MFRGSVLFNYHFYFFSAKKYPTFSIHELVLRLRLRVKATMCATILCTFSIKHWRAVEMNPRDGGVPSDTKLLIPFEKIYSGKYKNKTLQTIWNQEKISRVLTTTSLLPQYKSGTLYLNDIFFYCYTTQTVIEEHLCSTQV